MTNPATNPAWCTARTARARTAVHRFALPGMGFRAVHGLLGIFIKSYESGQQLGALERFTPAPPRETFRKRPCVRAPRKDPCGARHSRERTGERTPRVCARSGRIWEPATWPKSGRWATSTGRDGFLGIRSNSAPHHSPVWGQGWQRPCGAWHTGRGNLATDIDIGSGMAGLPKVTSPGKRLRQVAPRSIDAQRTRQYVTSRRFNIKRHYLLQFFIVLIALLPRGARQHRASAVAPLRRMKMEYHHHKFIGASDAHRYP